MAVLSRLKRRRSEHVCPYLVDGQGNGGRPVPRDGQVCTLNGLLPTRAYQGRRCVGGNHLSCELYQGTRTATLAECNGLASPPTARVLPLHRRRMGWAVRFAPLLFPVLALVLGLVISQDTQTSAMVNADQIQAPIVLAGTAPEPPPDTYQNQPIALPALDDASPTQSTIAPGTLSLPTEIPALPTPAPSADSATVSDGSLDRSILPQRAGTPHTVSGPPNRIVIPKIHLDSKVMEVGWVNQGHGTVWDVAAWAAGFHKSSAFPGQIGNTVLSGHNNTLGEVFRDLHLLHAGDTIDLYVGKQIFSYKITTMFIVPEKYATDQQRRDNAKWIGYFPDNRLTLVTCEPYTTYTHRLIVIANPVA